MSTVPQHTQILIKDFDFQAKYHLTHSQTDLISYLVNILSWAICIEGYYVIATSKIMSDLPSMGLKTIEASLKVLKDLELIESKVVKVTQWKGMPHIRGVKLTEKGKEYNAKLILPSQDERVIELQKKNRELEKENKALIETIKNLSVSESEASAPKKEEEKQKEKEEKKAKPTPSTPSMPTLEAIEVFIGDVTKRFGKTGKPICNAVPKWNIKTAFYINSYNKLSTLTPDNNSKQLKDPLEISHFWEWLFAHNQRIGDKVNFDKIPTVKELEKRFLNQTILIGKNREIVREFVETEEGIKIKVEDEKGKIRFIVDSRTQKDKVFELGEVREVLFGVLG